MTPITTVVRVIDEEATLDHVFRDYEYWIHEEGEILCDTDEENEAEPAEVKKTEIWRAA